MTLTDKNGKPLQGVVKKQKIEKIVIIARAVLTITGFDPYNTANVYMRAASLRRKAHA